MSIVHFVVKGTDKDTINLIHKECEGASFTPHIVYHGAVSFRGRHDFNLFSANNEIYELPIKDYGIMRSLHTNSSILQTQLIQSTYPLVGCIGRDIKNIWAGPSVATNIIGRTLILFEDCPTLAPWIKATERYLDRFKATIKSAQSVEHIINDLKMGNV